VAGLLAAAVAAGARLLAGTAELVRAGEVASNGQGNTVAPFVLFSAIVCGTLAEASSRALLRTHDT
jgi:hypothetical protein